MWMNTNANVSLLQQFEHHEKNKEVLVLQKVGHTHASMMMSPSFSQKLIPEFLSPSCMVQPTRGGINIIPEIDPHVWTIRQWFKGPQLNNLYTSTVKVLVHPKKGKPSKKTT